MFTFDPNAYGTACGELLRGSRLCALGPGQPNTAAQMRLSALTPEQLGSGKKVADVQMASCCLAALWLLHDFLDESHQLSQEIGSTSGSYWHAIMHRREPDFENSKYWFRRVGEHTIFPALRESAQELCASAAELAEERAVIAALSSQGPWDPFRFVDLCQTAAKNGSDLENVCRRIAHVEWQLLFDHCYGQAFRV